MNNQTTFSIKQGNLTSHCLPETQAFLRQNLDFFHKYVADMRNALNSDGPMILVSNEEQWNFAARIDRTELGKIVESSGVLIESGRCKFDEVVDSLKA